MKKWLTLLILFLLLYPTIMSHEDNAKADPEKNKTSGNLQNIKGIKIDFTAPEIIQDCGSSFFLDVTFTKTRFMDLPRVFSASVFLKIEDGTNNKIIRIGSSPIIHIPTHTLCKTVTISCLTTNNLIKHIYGLQSGGKEKISIRNAEIGVKIEKAPHWVLFDKLIWKTFAVNNIQSELWFWIGDNILWRSFQNNNFLLQRKPVVTIRLCSFLQWINSRIKERNPFIKWEDTKVVSPLICSKDVYINYYNVDEKSDKNGNFIVQINISHNFTENFTAGVLIDMADQPIINTFIPTLKVTRYNVGYFETTFTPPEDDTNYVNESIKCSFPNESFGRKKYNISIFLGPFIQTNGTSQFGRYFYNLRWKLLVKPFYVVDGEVQGAIEKLWYNTPIFFGTVQSPTIFQSEQGSIMYEGETPSEKFLKEAKEAIEENYFSLLVLVFSFLVPIILFISLVIWIVKKTS